MAYIDGLQIPLDENGFPMTAYSYNAPHSGYWFKNSRQQRLHVRRFLPGNPDELKCIVLYLHGYGAHVNSVSIRSYGESLCRLGIGVFMFDFVGHGFSDGERAYIDDYTYWIDDAYLLLKIVTEKGCAVCESEAFLGIEAPVWSSTLESVRFALTGQSLGGGLSILLGRRILKESSMLSSRFIGAVLHCPAIMGNTPHAAVLFILKHVVARLIPLTLIPNILERVQIPSMIWIREEDIIRARLDQWGRPGGLGWGHNMRFGTGLQLLNMIEDIRMHLDEVNFPFAVLHDPKDGIVRFEGTCLLMEQSTTSNDIYRAKEVYKLEGMKHDLLSNAGPMIIDFTSTWLLDRLKNIDDLSSPSSRD